MTIVIVIVIVIVIMTQFFSVRSQTFRIQVTFESQQSNSKSPESNSKIPESNINCKRQFLRVRCQVFIVIVIVIIIVIVFFVLESSKFQCECETVLKKVPQLKYQSNWSPRHKTYLYDRPIITLKQFHSFHTQSKDSQSQNEGK